MSRFTCVLEIVWVQILFKGMDRSITCTFNVDRYFEKISLLSFVSPIIRVQHWIDAEQ